MDAVVMCGGRGTRLEADVEKPLLPVGDRPMVDRVVDALLGTPAGPTGANRPNGASGSEPAGRARGSDPAESVPAIDRVVAAASPHAPATAAHLRDRAGVTVLETPGDGYVEDLDAALSAVETPALTVVADLPLLGPDAVDAVLWAHRRTTDGGSLTVRVPRELTARLGATVDDRVVVEDDGTGYLPAGINVVAGEGGTDADTETGSGTGFEDATYTSYDARLAVNVNTRADVAVAEALLCD